MIQNELPGALDKLHRLASTLDGNNIASEVLLLSGAEGAASPCLRRQLHRFPSRTYGKFRPRPALYICIQRWLSFRSARVKRFAVHVNRAMDEVNGHWKVNTIATVNTGPLRVTTSDHFYTSPVGKTSLLSATLNNRATV